MSKANKTVKAIHRAYNVGIRSNDALYVPLKKLARYWANEKHIQEQRNSYNSHFGNWLARKQNKK